MTAQLDYASPDDCRRSAARLDPAAAAAICIAFAGPALVFAPLDQRTESLVWALVFVNPLWGLAFALASVNRSARKGRRTTWGAAGLVANLGVSPVLFAVAYLTAERIGAAAC